MSSLQPDLVLTEAHRHVLIVTINRPGARNSIDQATTEAIERAMDRLDDTEELFAGVITGAGGTFCAGADLKSVTRGEKRVGTTRGVFGLLNRAPRKPLIAAVEGFAVGGGFELCLACDLIVAAETARFGLPEVRLNLVATGGALFRLPRRMPYHLAMELALTAEFRDAAFFHRWGVVNRVVPSGQALNAALELAESLEANGPTAVAATKQIICSSVSWSSEEEAWRAQERIAATVDSKDSAEGLAAFAEKRKPVWRRRR